MDPSSENNESCTLLTPTAANDRLSYPDSSPNLLATLADLENIPPLPSIVHNNTNRSSSSDALKHDRSAAEEDESKDNSPLACTEELQECHDSGQTVFGTISRQSSSSALAAVLTSLHSTPPKAHQNGQDTTLGLVSDLQNTKSSLVYNTCAVNGSTSLAIERMKSGNGHDKTRTSAQINFPTKLKCSLVRQAQGAQQNPTFSPVDAANMIATQMRAMVSRPRIITAAQIPSTFQSQWMISPTGETGHNYLESNGTTYCKMEKRSPQQVSEFHHSSAYTIDESQGSPNNHWIIENGNSIWIDQTQLKSIPLRGNFTNYTPVTNSKHQQPTIMRCLSPEDHPMEEEDEIWKAAPLVISTLPPLQPQTYIPCPPNFYFSNPNVPSSSNGMNGGLLKSENNGKRSVRELMLLHRKKSKKQIVSNGTSTTSSPSSNGSSEKRYFNSIQTKPKRFFCSLCSKGFTQKGGLVNHERIHRGERPYVCSRPGCGKSFVQKCNLTRHERVHTGEKPYQCPINICGKRFNRKWGLTQHMKQTHQAIDGEYDDLGPQRKITRHSHTRRRASNKFTENGPDDTETKASRTDTSSTVERTPVLPSLELETSDVADLGNMMDKFSPQTNLAMESGDSSPHFTFNSVNSLGYIQSMNGHSSTSTNIAGIAT